MTISISSPSLAFNTSTTATTHHLNNIHSNRATPTPKSASSPSVRHIWLIMGPAGCGKTTSAKYLSNITNYPYVEGDNFHSPSNIEKMANGIPLTDADRWDWLTSLRDAALQSLEGNAGGVVVTCSALKRKYRDVIRVAAYFDPTVHIHFLFLYAPEDVILSRVQARENHYMGAAMVRSQYAILERPGSDEKDIVTVDVTRTLEEIQAEIKNKAEEAMKEEVEKEKEAR